MEIVTKGKYEGGFIFEGTLRYMTPEGENVEIPIPDETLETVPAGIYHRFLFRDSDNERVHDRYKEAMLHRNSYDEEIFISITEAGNTINLAPTRSTFDILEWKVVTLPSDYYEINRYVMYEYGRRYVGVLNITNNTILYGGGRYDNQVVKPLDKRSLLRVFDGKHVNIFDIDSYKDKTIELISHEDNNINIIFSDGTVIKIVYPEKLTDVVTIQKNTVMSNEPLRDDD